MKKLFIILIVLTIVGCSSSNKNRKRLVFMENIVEIKIDSVEELTVEKNSKITFKLWGYDVLLADAKATLLKEYTYNISTLPVSYGLDYKKEWAKNITPSQSGELGYYVTVEISGENGKKYKIDYDATDKDYFGTRKKSIEDVTGEIYIKEVF